MYPTLILHKALNLYSTAHCHLCDEAVAVLNNSSVESVRMVEIAEDENLLSIYGTRIPVLQRLDTKAELNWPFDAADIVRFLSD